MALSNTIIVSGVLGVLAGGLFGAALGRRMSGGAQSPMPEALGLFGALGGGVLFAAIGNNMANATTISSSTTAQSQTLSDNTQNANGLQRLPPPGA